MNFFGKFPLVRLKQFRDNPCYILFWIKRVLWYKRTSFRYINKYTGYQPLSPAQTLAHIIDNNLSIIRFGDGEFGLLSGAGIYPPDSDWSQKYSRELQQEIERQLQLQHPKLLLAFPSREHLIYREGDRPILNIISSMHTEVRMFLWRYLQLDQTYGDWSVFMPHHQKSLDWQKISAYLADKTVVVVTGGVEKLQTISLGARTLFIECGKHDAFGRRTEIIDSINFLVESEKLDKENTLFWVSLGCTSGSIIEYLVNRGYVSWDTGHIFRFADKELRMI